MSKDIKNNGRLKNGNPSHELTAEDRRKGAYRANKIRHEKKLLKDLAMELLSSDSAPNIAKSLQKIGIDDVSNGMAIMVGQLKEAMKGNTRAAEFLRDTSGQKPKEELSIDNPVSITFEDDFEG